MAGLCISQGSSPPPPAHAPLPPWTLLREHKVQDKSLKSIRWATAQRTTGPWLSGVNGQLWQLTPSTRSPDKLTLTFHVKQASVYNRDGKELPLCTWMRLPCRRWAWGVQAPVQLPFLCVTGQSLAYLQRLLEPTCSNNNLIALHKELIEWDTSRVVMITETLPNLTWPKGFTLSVREIRNERGLRDNCLLSGSGLIVCKNWAVIPSHYSDARI